MAVGIPVVTWINFIVVCFATVIVITGNLSLDLKKLIIAFLVTAISLTLQLAFPKKIQEGFMIYPTEKNEFLEKTLPQEVNSYLQKTIKENYSVRIPSKEYSGSYLNFQSINRVLLTGIPCSFPLSISSHPLVCTVTLMS